MNCTRCGREIPDGEKKICDDCEKKLLEELKQTENEESLIEVGTQENIKEKDAQENIEEKTVQNNEKKCSKKCLKLIDKIIIIVCIAFVCVVVALACLAYITREVPGNTIGNIRNFGYAAKQGKWIYYSAPNDDSTKVGIFKIKDNGEDKQQLFMSNADIVSINVYKDNIYFIGIELVSVDGNEELDNKIYRMKLDGSDLQIINDNEFSDDCYEMYVVNNKVYYVGIEGTICTMNLDGSEKAVLVDIDTGYLGITDKYIIYNAEVEDEEDYVTYIMNIDGTNPRPLIEGKRLNRVNIEGSYVYYTDKDEKIFRTKIDSNYEELVCDTEAYNLNTKGKYAYYINYKDPENEDYTICIFRVKLNGKNKAPELIKEMSTYSLFIDVVGDWVIYMDSDNTAGYMNLVKVNGSGELIQLFYLNYEEYYNSVIVDDYSNMPVDGVEVQSDIEE